MRSVDLQLIKTFKTCLDLKNKIGSQVSQHKNGKLSYRLQFGGAQFYRWLMKIGLFPAKTYTIEKILIPDQYFVDFLRGHLDGDGSITVYQDRYNTFKNPTYIYTRLWVRFISASPKHIDWLHGSIKRLCGVHGHRAQSKIYDDKHVSISILKFGKKESIRLLQWIYYKKDLPCLLRKREIADKFLLRA